MVENHILAVDIGNSNVKLATGLAESAIWSNVVRVSADQQRTADEWHSLLATHFALAKMDECSWRVVCCSVVPAIAFAFEQYVRAYLTDELLFVNAAVSLGITVATTNPDETGADRIVNAASAWHSLRGPVIVVDAGTATKIDAVSATGALLGGAIAPGLGLSIESLARRAAQLSAVPLQTPRHVIGQNTVTAVQSGVVRGHISMIDGTVRAMQEELGADAPVLLTGGFSSLIASDITTPVDVRPNLTLDGLRIISKLNIPSN